MGRPKVELPTLISRESVETTLDRLKDDMKVLCWIHGFKAPRLGILPPHENHYGECSADNKTIAIQVERIEDGRHRVFHYHELLDTLCHELAHIRENKHDRKFRRLYMCIKASATALGMFAECDWVIPGQAS